MRSQTLQKHVPNVLENWTFEPAEEQVCTELEEIPFMLLRAESYTFNCHWFLRAPIQVSVCRSM